MKYPMAVKSARLQAVAAQISAGDGKAHLEILGAGTEGVLARIPLPAPPEVKGDELVVIDSPTEVRAIAEGTPSMGRVVNGLGEVVLDELKRGPGGDFDTDQDYVRIGQTVRATQLLIIHP
jgi:hypothetical protein